MNREEAIEELKLFRESAIPWDVPILLTAIDMAIEALECEPSEDGTLEIKVEDATKVGRVLITDDKHRGGLYYPDEDEPQGDLISRADAIEALGEEPPVWCDEEYEIAERDQWRADIEAIQSVPPADRPSGYRKRNTTYKNLVFCSECDMAYEAGMTPRNFCPNCGADMRGDTK